MDYHITKLKSVSIIAAAGVLLFGAGGVALAASQSSNQTNGNQKFQASLTEVNGSGATGLATATVDAQGMGHFHIVATGLINAPHAQHVHFGIAAAHECPATSADANGDGVIDTTEGGPSYGPVQTSLTTNGDTSPTSTLAVDRYPTYANNAVYDRTFQLTSQQAQEVRSGLSIVVVHGIDSVQKDGKYDGALQSELDPKLPQEATAPAACGPLHQIAVTDSITNTTTNNTSSSAKNLAYAAMVLGAVALVLALVGSRRKDR